MSETHTRGDVPSPGSIDFKSMGFKEWRTERCGSSKGGGGLLMLYKDELQAHQWDPHVTDDYQYIKKERQWLIIGGKTAFLHIYVACETKRPTNFEQWNQDLFSLVTQEALILRQQGMCCLALGDFNTRVGKIRGLEGNLPGTNTNYPAFMSFVSQVNMTIINTLPISKGIFTRFMHGSKSLLDYGLIDNDHVSSVSSFVIDEEARFGCGSVHALLECKIFSGRNSYVEWKFTDSIQYNIHASTDYTQFKTKLDENVATIPLNEFSTLSVEAMLPHLIDNIGSL